MAIQARLKRRYDDRQLKHVFPNWYILIYGAAVGFLIPWTILLSLVLPPHYVSQHWDIAWVGFDSFEILLFALSAVLVLRRSTWAALTSVMLGTTLLIDAWFDIMTTRSHRSLSAAIIEAFVLEIPLAIVSFMVAHRIFNYIRHNPIN